MRLRLPLRLEVKPRRAAAVLHEMQPRRALLAATFTALALVALTFGKQLVRMVPTASADEALPPGATVPVLVELFTSEGCSSCPPAEDELSRLESAQPIPGVRVVPVGFHVDYWNNLGWTDPFSTAAWTERQREYAQAGSRGTGLYTPEAVVQGGRDCVGSDDSALRSLVRQAAALPAAHVVLTRSTATSAPNEVRVSVNVTSLPAGTPGDQAELRLVLVERGVVVDVPRGENGGKRLHHVAVARDLAMVGRVSGGGGTSEGTLTVPPASRRDALGVIAVVQERLSRRVLGVGTLDL